MLITFKSEQSWAYRKCLYTWHVSPDHSYLAPHPSFLAEVPSVFNPLTKLGVPIRVLESCLWNRAAHLHGIAFIISFLHGSVGEESICKARDTGDVGLIPGSGRFPGGNGNPLQYSCLKNPTDRKAWWATIYGVAKSQTRSQRA